MTRNEAKKRLTKIKGVPLKPIIEPRVEVRKGMSRVEYVNEYESEFNDFFEFEEDLSELEAARKQVERIEEEKILHAARMRRLGIESNESEESESDSFYTIIDEEENESVDL